MTKTTEQQAYAAIKSTFDDLTGWFERLKSPYIPGAGTELENDDSDWPPMPVSQLAWIGLAGAADHLDAIRHQILTKRLFSFAQLTLCRSALVGAAQAVWVLAPDDQSLRIKRARIVAAYVYEHRLKYLYELRKLYPDDEGIEFQVSKDELRQKQLQDKCVADGQPKKTKLFTGKMIEEAVSEAFNKPELTANGNLSWMSGSGAAHGQVWQHFNTQAMQISGASGQVLTDFTVGTTLNTFANHYCTAFETAKRGWEILDARATPERRGRGTAE